MLTIAVLPIISGGRWRAEKIIGNEPDELYFVFSAIVPWWVWHIRVDSRSYSIWIDQTIALGKLIPERLLR
jgi:hypothetical protein